MTFHIKELKLYNNKNNLELILVANTILNIHQLAPGEPSC